MPGVLAICDPLTVPWRRHLFRLESVALDKRERRASASANTGGDADVQAAGVAGENTGTGAAGAAADVIPGAGPSLEPGFLRALNWGCVVRGWMGYLAQCDTHRHRFAVQWLPWAAHPQAD